MADELLASLSLMSQTVPTTGNSQIQDPYAVYADSFDLSLLPSTSPFTTTATTTNTSIKSDDDEIPLNTIQSLSLSLSLSSSSSSSSSSSLPLSPITELSPESQLVSIDYIPATIYHDQSIKLEKPWNQKDPNTNTGHNNNSSSNNNNNNCEDKKHITISSNKITAPAISHHQISSSSPSSDTSILLQQFQKHYQFYPSPLPSPPQESSASSLSSITTSGGGGGGGGTISIYPPSPCPSIEQNQNFQNFHIKQEFHILPPSPPESNGAPSPAACCIDIKSEPETDTSETLLDISSLLENSITSSSSSSLSHSLSQRESSSISQQQQQQQQQPQNHQQIVQVSKKPAQDHQLLREYLQDTTFQKKHNLKPLALESLFGGFGVRADIEPVISLALEHAKRDAQATCALLKISPDPQQWTTSQVHAWIRSTIEQFKLPSNNDIEMKFPENGSALMCLSEDEFNRRVPEAGSTIHAQLEIWKLACSENFSTDFGLPPTTTILPPSTIINGSLISNSTWNSHTNCSDTMNMDMDISGDEDEEMIPISAASSSIHHHHHHHDNTSNISVIPLGRTSPPPAPSMVATATSPSTNNEINSTTSLLTPNTMQQITSTDCTTVDINGTTNTSTNSATLLLSKSTKTSTIASMAATATPSTETVAATVAATATPTSLTTTSAATTPKSGTRPSSSHIHLWQFLKELLASPQLHGTAIRWLDRSKGVFKIEDSVRVAKLWGRRKNRPAMNYDKLSRSIRQYYKKGIMKKTERSQRLVYQFCHPYSL